MNNTAHAVAANDSLALHLRDASRLANWGMAVLVCGVLPIAAWMSFAPLSSAVVAQAHVKVDLNRRPVQHAEGGIVREVLVRDGQRVRQGEPLLVLGDVSVDADRNRLDHRFKTERAGLARLDAEQSLAHAITFPSDVVETAAVDPRLAEQMDRERVLFEARRDALAGQVQLLRSQREKVAEEIVALRAQIAQASESLKFQKGDLETNKKLLRDGFISAARIAQLEGAVADYGVKIEERRAELARAQQRTVDADLRIRSLESDYRQQASDQRKAMAARLSEIEQERRKSLDASARQVITAAVSGEIIDLRYSTPGAVIPPRETIADIVPEGARLLIEARVRTEDINRVRREQPADVRLTAFQHRTTHLVHGKVVYVSGDRLVERVSNIPYYSVLVEVDPASLSEAGDLKLLAGMPAEVYVTGETRTALQYLLEPILQVLRRSLRER